MRQDIQLYNDGSCAGGLNPGALQNCLQIQPYGGYTLGQQYCYHHPESLGDFELSVNQLSQQSEPLLNYGSKLRLIIADPIQGIDLRDAITKLRTSLKEAYAKHKSV